MSLQPLLNFEWVTLGKESSVWSAFALRSLGGTVSVSKRLSRPQPPKAVAEGQPLQALGHRQQLSDEIDERPGNSSPPCEGPSTPADALHYVTHSVFKRAEKSCFVFPGSSGAEFT